MWIMNLVWPITAFYAGPLALWGYFTARPAFHQPGRRKQGTRRRVRREKRNRSGKWWLWARRIAAAAAPWAISSRNGRFSFFRSPFLGKKIFAAWVVDYILAFGFGIVFQYFTIAPMRDLCSGKESKRPKPILVADGLADRHVWLDGDRDVRIFRHEIPKTDPLFWFMMQIAMLAGFLTSYPRELVAASQRDQRENVNNRCLRG